MAERTNAVVLKTISLRRLAGSNPAPSANHGYKVIPAEKYRWRLIFSGEPFYGNHVFYPGILELGIACDQNGTFLLGECDREEIGVSDKISG